MSFFVLCSLLKSFVLLIKILLDISGVYQEPGRVIEADFKRFVQSLSQQILLEIMEYLSVTPIK